jgi:hypothetical protein
VNNVRILILGADGIMDGEGDLSETDRIRQALRDARCRVKAYEIASIQDGWHRPLPENRLRCACSPMQAMLDAMDLFSRGEAEAVVVYGKDHIRSTFRNRKAERDALMHLYGEDGHILKAYDLLAHAFLKHWHLRPEEFKALAEWVFENHWRVWRGLHPDAERPNARWFEPVTDLFRGVDCANPSVDFEGCLILGTREAAEKCHVVSDGFIEIAGCCIEQIGEDTPETIPDIVPYGHLRMAFEAACRQAGLDFPAAFVSGKALLETYSCYPVVPLGFLLASRLVPSFGEIPKFLEKHPITITGGLNLAKAPWNNTTLYAISEMVKRLRRPGAPAFGGIHSIGALGYKQAFAILRRFPSRLPTATTRRGVVHPVS